MKTYLTRGAVLAALLLPGACAVPELTSTCTAAPGGAAGPCSFTEIKKANS